MMGFGGEIGVGKFLVGICFTGNNRTQDQDSIPAVTDLMSAEGFDADQGKIHETSGVESL